MILALFLGACRAPDAVAPVPTLVEAARKVTYTTVTELGAYQLGATIHRELSLTDHPPQVTDEKFNIRWKDLDNWAFSMARDERPVEDVLVFASKPFTKMHGKAWAQRGDPEMLRTELSSTWDPWAKALENFGEQIGFTLEGQEVVEGRKAQRYSVNLLPAAGAKSRRVWTPREVSGTVWLDEVTAVRLRGEVRGKAVSESQVLDVVLLFWMIGIGTDPELSMPETSDGP